MYAVVSTGGKQYKVAPGDRLRVEKIDAEPGNIVELGPVHLLVKTDGITADPESLKAVKVLAEVATHGRSKKIRIYQYKRRKNYRRTQGHRQSYTEIRIKDIQA
jgi:large subunit ribosomal protein L21